MVHLAGKCAPTTANEVQRLAYLATVMKYLVVTPFAPYSDLMRMFVLSYFLVEMCSDDPDPNV